MINGLIIEGPDNVGKTTLANGIAEMCGWEVSHCDKPPQDVEYPTFYLQHLKMDMVVDRFVASNHVYGRCLGLHEACSFISMRGIQQSVRDKGFKTLLLYSSSDIALRHDLETNGKKELFDIETIVAANSHFRDMITEGCMGLPWFDHYWDVAACGYMDPQDATRLLNGS